MILYDSQIKHNENIEDETENMYNQSLSLNRQLIVPKFPTRKRPSLINTSSISTLNTTSSSTQMITQYRKMVDSNEKRDLEILIIKNLSKEKKSDENYVVQKQWAQQYQKYLYNNGNKPGKIDNTDLLDYILINGAVWSFLKEEYQAYPEIHVKHIRSSQRNNDKRSRTVEPSINKKENLQATLYELPLVGMKNDSYFCYMHAGLQCLLSLCDLNYFIINSVKKILKQTNQKPSEIIQFNYSYLELIQQIKSSKGVIKLDSIKQLIINKFHPKNQHDCHEFLLYLLGKMEDEILAFNKEIEKTKSMYVNYIELLFKGKSQSTIICQKCKYIVKLQEPFLILSLAITHSKTLESCLEDYFKEEVLKDYKCSKCQSTCIKSTKIIQPPKILILQLKRFQYFPTCHKNNKPVVFPIDVLPVANHTYRLKGFIVHTGNLQQGHYYSYGKRYGSFFQFNDDSIIQVSKRQMLSQMAYILFYQVNENI